MARGSEFDHTVETAVVTGATGDVGPWVIDRLADAGVRVVGVDLERPASERANTEFRAVDLTNHGETWETIHEIDPDAVIHFAAISGLLDDPGTRIFRNNAMGTYNTLVAAGRVGAEVVWTSSQAAYGILFAEDSLLPEYLPVDETHPRRPGDPYGLSKVCGEEIARSVARRYDVPVTTIRPASVYTPDEYRTRPKRKGFDLSSMELSGDLWSFVDVRDVARMAEAALSADYDGYEEFLCVADDNYLGHPTAELIEAAAGELPDVCEIEGTESAFTNEKAREVLGWEPAHVWGEAEAPDIEWL